MPEVTTSSGFSGRSPAASELAGNGCHSIPQLAKMTPPAAAEAVPRPELCAELCSLSAPRVTLVRAPAGFGKSTLMQQACRELAAQGVPVAWLTLDSADNDVSRLLQFLSYAMAVVSDQDGVQDNGFGVGNLALALLDQVAATAAPFAIFLDDLEVLQSAAAVALLQQFIERLPAGGRVVIGSRVLPNLGLSRWRGRGQLLELDPARLRFSMDESHAFLQRVCGNQLEQDELQLLHGTTEGWPVALRLASLLLRDCPDRSAFVRDFSGTNALVADYLTEEVLARLPEETLAFMLQTSTLPQLTAPLCDAVCGISNSRDILESLERANLFLVTLDSQRQSYRYHGLFATFLRAEAERRFPERLPQLHRAAAQWYIDAGRQVPAIEQALLSRDWDFALPLFQRHAESLLCQGRSRLLVRLLASVPASQLSQWPQLQIVHMWAVAFTRGAEEAMGLLARYESDSRAEVGMVAHVRALRPMLLSILDRHDEAYESAAGQLQAVADEYVFPKAILRTSLAFVALVMGRYGEAQQLLDEGRGSSETDAGPFTHIYAQCVEGVLDLLQGRLRQASAHFRLAANINVRGINSTTNGNTMAAILLSEALYESGDLAAAGRLLQVYAPLMREQGVPDHTISSHRNLARIQHAAGDREAALQTLTELEYCGHVNDLPRMVASAHLERASLLIQQGDALAAGEEISRARHLCDWDKLESWWLLGNDTESLLVTELRWQIHFGEAQQALARLPQLVARAESERRQRRALKLRVLQALALAATDEHEQSLALLGQVLQKVAQEPCVRCVMDEGRPLQQLLVRYATACATVIDDAEWQQPGQLLLRLAALPLIGGDGAEEEALAELSQPLTKKELQALRLLADGLSNAAIAARMFVSENTVRTHLRNINNKLESGNRTEAVAIARRHGLLC
nr:LuxR C-terminal-related transcriptional regulator [Pseudomaricurvus sp. HS19]